MSADETKRGQAAFVALDAAEEQRLIELLRDAWAPPELDQSRHDRLLRAALDDPFAPASPDELAQSERLRRALDGDGDHLDLVLARALAAAHAPNAVTRTAYPPLSLPASRNARRMPARLSYLRFGSALAGLAAAAAVIVAVNARSSRAPVPDLPALALAQSRSTAPLFPAAAALPPSARIDRIAGLRERDLRANRYALWGVQ